MQAPETGPTEYYPGIARPLVIGLVNGMPGESGRYTEQQFRGVLAASAGDTPIELRFLSLEAFAPGGAAVPDGLIVTGMPPRAAALTDEPCWHNLTRLADFAIEHGVPTVWSCLAAHAAVLYLDGIERRRLPQKLSGLVACVRTDALHPSVSGLPRRWRVPHSRYNELPEDDLRARGYRMLSRSPAAGADLFLKDVGTPFLFCQGHPEYDADTLLREYRRDIRQFLTGERDSYPAPPERMFGRKVTALLAAFRDRALDARSVDILAEFPWTSCVAELSHSWRSVAVRLYANWLTQVAEIRARRREAGAARRVPASSRMPDAALVLGAGSD